MFDHIRVADRVVLLLNTLLLMAVVFLPFATSVVAGALRSGHGERTAVFFYGIAFDVTALTFNAVWQYARRHRLLSEALDSAGATAISRRFQLALAWLTTCALLGAVLPVLGVVVIAAFNAFTGFRSGARVHARDPREAWHAQRGLTNPGNVRRAATAACAAGLLALAVAVGATAAGSPSGHVAIYLVQGEQLVRVMRVGASATDAVEQLVAGPTAAEVKHGMRTYVPTRTRVRSLAVAHGLATVDLGARFASGRDEMSLLARLSQLVRTLTGRGGAKRVQLLVDGAKVSGVFPDVRTAKPITFRFLQTPNVAVPTPPQPRLLPPNAHIRDVQQRLIELGYLIDGDADGRLGPVTQNAVLAFQKWERLNRTGLLDTRTESRLQTASRPTPLSRGGAGKRAEIALDRQVALLIDNNEVVRAIAVSSGKPSTPTPPGSYRVYAKITRWWSTPFREWLPWALPFVGGIAFHEFADVPAYPASHGCVRQSFAVARWTYDFADVGMPVKVITR